MEVNSSERNQETEHVAQVAQHENSASEGLAYPQKTVSDPANAILHHQIQGNTAKMLMTLPTGEQKLTTFGIPNEDCTVQVQVQVFGRTSTANYFEQISVKPIAASTRSPAEHNTRVANIDMEVNSSEHGQETEYVAQQSPSPRLQHENSASENIAYLQKIISDPANATVQHQIQGNTAKMLVMLPTGEQRLITFDIPNEDCTVHDLLDEVNIPFAGETQISLVDDPAMGINYIVNVGGSRALTTFFEGSDDCNSSQENKSSSGTETLSQNTNASDENNNASTQTTEEPILVKGMLALCPHCGYSSLHFNRCERCNTKLKTEEVKSISIAERKEAGISVGIFYKNNERNVTKLEKVERDDPPCKRPRGNGKGAASKLFTKSLFTKPIRKKSECLTISSDEEGRPKKTGSVICYISRDVPHFGSNQSNPSCVGHVLKKKREMTYEHGMLAPTENMKQHQQHTCSVANIDMEDNSSERGQETERRAQRSPLSRLQYENNAGESIVFLRETISDPANTIVQDQIQGSRAKMLVMLPTGKQRLITFDIPNEDCTVHDLLDQVNIPFAVETQISLVDDPTLGINYIVDVGSSGVLATSLRAVTNNAADMGWIGTKTRRRREIP
ncbi:PREDICTED: uncharacterized protein LOC105462807 [Wasmannia auropunctata]|uniref:uncharacterized protein LOC105462807 n=1 Tax=Wasmannia auropunctata TaxID=64793 RepID=UPI0005F07F0D|nr:PREDICTED: uncharacterized protein LOC105462807 [Wasmannia auropunctata]